jgi:hypothetical protein
MVSSTSSSADDEPPADWIYEVWGKKTTQAEHMLQAGSDEGDVNKVVAALMQVNIQCMAWRWPRGGITHAPPSLVAPHDRNIWC